MKGWAKEKQAIREEVWARMLRERISPRSHDSIPPFRGQEQAAELLSTLEPYIGAGRVFVPPDQAQYPVRLNILRHWKTLVMATPGLKDGFYEIEKEACPALWEVAVRSYGISKHGKRLATSYEAVGRIDLMVTGAVAVSRRGERIGKGTGYFDWEYAILREITSVGDETPIIAVVHETQVYEELPWEAGDVSVDYIVTPERIIRVEDPRPRPQGIDWSRASKGLIAKMRPLRELYHGSSPKP